MAIIPEKKYAAFLAGIGALLFLVYRRKKYSG